MVVKEWKLTANQLKTLAVIAMLFDHIAWWLLPTRSVAGQLVHAFGRITAPLMCYFIAEGYYHTSNFKKYLGRLLLFAALSHFPYVLYFGYGLFSTTGFLWGLAMGLLALFIMDRETVPLLLKFAGFLVCCAIAYRSDWSYMPVFCIVWFGLSRGNFKLQMVGYGAFVAVTKLLPVFLSGSVLPNLYRLGMFLAIPLLLLYNGERGGKEQWKKWFFYGFYPLHLLMLYLIRLCAYLLGGHA